MDFFNSHCDVDLLVCDDRLTRRKSEVCIRKAHIAPETIVTIVYPPHGKRIIMVNKRASLEISADTLQILEALHTADAASGNNGVVGISKDVEHELTKALGQGFLRRAEE
jgi:hypothetical protein